MQMNGIEPMKVLIYQVHIGNSGYIYKNYLEVDTLKYCQPSVLRYCKKYGYEYQLIDSNPGFDIDWYYHKLFPKRKCSSTLIRYLLMGNNNYDAIVSLDNDIYITEHAEPLPFIEGHMGVHSYHNINRYNNKPFINGGVQMVDQNTGFTIKKFFEKICDKKVLPPDSFFSDQYFINYFRSKNPHVSFIIPSKWNYLIKENQPLNYKSVNFIHYASEKGRRQLLIDAQQSLL
jgi:hypothetical protein